MKVIAIKDIKDLDGKKIIAKRGRIGIVSDAFVELYGIGENRKDSFHIPVKFEGNKINRDVPNWLLEETV